MNFVANEIKICSADHQNNEYTWNCEQNKFRQSEITIDNLFIEILTSGPLVKEEDYAILIRSQAVFMPGTYQINLFSADKSQNLEDNYLGSWRIQML